MVYFVGAGPGDPDLITVKGARLIREADIIVYAGSLVNPELLALAKPGAEIYNSAAMTLAEVLEVLIRGSRQGKLVVRLHTGDPSLYGAIQEQLDRLREAGIPAEVVPGVSSAFAAAAALQRELTLPGVSQTVIFTRRGGRTPVPEKESLNRLACHQATMAIFLSVGQIEAVVAELRAGGYDPETPVAVVQKASWPDQVVVRGTLATIARQVKERGITKTAIILVGEALATGDYSPSCLYDASFSHGFREGKDCG
ncbi:MAG TPA: precorrin-4 C(11)-methyltransferase [Clostridia bacterium]|nr:precorrin-4 C(11)-methyltransferase [Clostridia bacterium]